jgi:hypothetical protein
MGNKIQRGKVIMKKLLFLLFTFSFAFSVEEEKLKITFDFDSSTYRLGFPVYVNVKIINTGERDEIIKLSPFDFESFYFLVRTPENDVLDLKDEYKLITREYKGTPEMYKEILLSPGESISRRIDLAKCYDFRKAGFYYIKVYFYPDPDVKVDFFTSDDYKILLKPPLVVESEIVKENLERKEEFQKLKLLPPYEVVDNLIDAKMKKDWERFLFHFDLERLILSFQNYATAYQNARTGRYKLEILEDFKRYLTVHWQDRILSYKILESYIKEGEATVDADVEYKVRQLSYVLRYTFKLYRNYENQWKVYDYTVLRVK